MAAKKKTKNRKSYSSQKAVVPMRGRRARLEHSTKEPDWARLPDRELMQWRICDLGLQLEQTPIQLHVDKVFGELAQRKIKFRPHAWLSDDWYSPDGIPGIAIPFYIAHPRLVRLERSQMLEVEGGTQQWCLKILRHEIGHAFDTAYRIHRRKKYRENFGRYSEPYPETYRPKPSSKDFVLHLEPWYAQSHPAEDFAETFAVWLKSRSRWRRDYVNWPALKKLEFVDEIFNKIKDTPPPINSRRRIDPVHRIKKTLGEYYSEKREHYGYDKPSYFDRDLKRLFASPTPSNGRRTAAGFLQRHRAELSRVVSTWTGEYRYNVNQVLREMIDRCREMNLRTMGDENLLKQNALAMLAVHTMSFLHGGHHRVAL